MTESTALTRAECAEFLAGHSTGRVGLSMDALPTIVAVPYRYEDGAVVIPVPAESRLAKALDHNVVCFEIDGVDPSGSERWTVVAVGRASVRANAAIVPLSDGLGEIVIALERLTGGRSPDGADGSALVERPPHLV